MSENNIFVCDKLINARVIGSRITAAVNYSSAEPRRGKIVTGSSAHSFWIFHDRIFHVQLRAIFDKYKLKRGVLLIKALSIHTIRAVLNALMDVSIIHVLFQVASTLPLIAPQLMMRAYIGILYRKRKDTFMQSAILLFKNMTLMDYLINFYRKWLSIFPRGIFVYFAAMIRNEEYYVSISYRRGTYYKDTFSILAT